ncbi:MAG: hypothetical protein IJ757_00540 [Clostridiales bacterium]|nr:hypothetical protein [Clostridiales bacterium]
MRRKKDETILYECYLKLIRTKRVKKRKKPSDMDQSIAGFIRRDTRKLLEGKVYDVAKTANRLKTVYMQYAALLMRNPDIIDGSLKRDVRKSLKQLCILEAKQIAELRAKVPFGYRINLERIFDDYRIRQLSSKAAVTIVSEYLYSTDTISSFEYFMTSTGTRYHSITCGYCQNKNAVPVPPGLIKNLGLEPCKCISSGEGERVNNINFVTAFVDESISPVEWDEFGQKGVVSTFSYIICAGVLKDETQIGPENELTHGVEMSKEKEHIEKITDSAIGKVLITLAYDYRYSGAVRIYTDNAAAACNWHSISRNSRLASMFKSVKVCRIPREKNTRADRLLRSRVLLDLPRAAYVEAVKKCSLANNLEAQSDKAV